MNDACDVVGETATPIVSIEMQAYHSAAATTICLGVLPVQFLQVQSLLKRVIATTATISSFPVRVPCPEQPERDGAFSARTRPGPHRTS
jgi:hypothetical protein